MVEVFLDGVYEDVKLVLVAEFLLDFLEALNKFEEHRHH